MSKLIKDSKFIKSLRDHHEDDYWAKEAEKRKADFSKNKALSHKETWE